MNFKVGQKVVCIHSGQWYYGSSVIPGTHPQKDEVVTIRAIDGEHLAFREYDRHLYNKTCFRPLDELTSYGINDLLEWLPLKEQKQKVNI